MRSSASKSARQLLDEVHRLAQVQDFDSARYLELLAADVADEDDGTPEGAQRRDAQIRAALAALDSFASRMMRIRLDHLLAGDNSVAPQFRTYLATQVLDYEGKLETLQARVAQIAVRVDPQGAAETAAAVANAAGLVLSLRTRIRQGILALVPPEEPDEPEEEPPERHFFEMIELD